MGNRWDGSPWAGAFASSPVANPAAGADWTVTLTKRALIWSVSCTLTVSGIATRLPVLTVTDIPNSRVTVRAIHGGASFVTGTSTNLTWAPGLNRASSAVSGAAVQNAPLPFPLWVEAGWSLSVVTDAIQAGDQWSSIVIVWNTFTTF